MPGDIMYDLAGAKRDHISQTHFEAAAITVLGELNYNSPEFPSFFNKNDDGTETKVFRGLKMDDNEYLSK
jgi:hypothetical protein